MTAAEVPARARRMRPEDRRDQILHEAYGLIAASGFNAVSLADIAAAAGIRKSSVLYHFPSMNDLLLAVLAMRELQDYEFYLATPEAHDAGAARRRFTRVFEHNLERAQLVRLYAILSGESLAPGHPAHGYFVERGKQARAEMARSLMWKRRPELAAAELLAFWDGLHLAWCHEPDLDACAVWEAFCDRFFAAATDGPGDRAESLAGSPMHA